MEHNDKELRILLGQLAYHDKSKSYITADGKVKLRTNWLFIGVWTAYALISLFFFYAAYRGVCCMFHNHF